MTFDIQKYIASRRTLPGEAERDLQAKRENLSRLRDAARKALAERHQDELDATAAYFNAEFDRLNGRPAQ
jgi:hypothetical protein